MRNNIFFPIVILFLFQSCSSLPDRKVMESEVQNFNLPVQPNKSDTLIYVVRPSGMGAVVRFNVHLDSKEDDAEMGFTRGGQYIYFFVEPGRHTLWSNAENWGVVEINSKAGETIYVKQDPSFGFLYARNSLFLLDELEGKYHVKNLKVGTIKKDRKNK